MHFCRWQKCKVAAAWGRRPTVHRTVGTDLSNSSLIPSHETKTPPFGGAFVSWLRERDLNPRPPGYELK